MKCEHCGGAIIHEVGYFPNPPRDYCHACGRELKTVSNNLDPQKEEKVKTLLKDHSIREIVKKTGVAKNTIARVRNENLTEEEKAEFKKRANVRGRNKRELKKGEPEIQTKLPAIIPKKILKPSKLTFDDIAKKQFEALEKRYEELAQHIKVECAELIKLSNRIAGLGECISFAEIADEMTIDDGWKQYLERTSDDLYEEKEAKEKEIK